MSKQRSRSPQQKRPQQQGKGQGQTQTEKAPAAKLASAKPNAEIQAEQAAKQEAKRDARMQRQEAEKAARERRRRMSKLRNVAIIALAVILVAGGATAYFLNEANKPGQGVSQQVSRPHLASITSPHVPYNSDPPTSGPHAEDVPSWGVHAEPVAKELQVHALEDAGVIINYQPDLDAATVDRLEALTESYGTDLLLAPYPGLSNPIVLTAWTRIDRLDVFDEVRIKRFIDAFRGIDHHGDSGS